MKNTILDKIINSNPMYCHAIEISSVHELENVCDSFYNEFIGTHSLEVIEEFLTSLEVYVISYIDDEGVKVELTREQEEEIYNFDISGYLKTL